MNNGRLLKYLREVMLCFANSNNTMYINHTFTIKYMPYHHQDNVLAQRNDLDPDYHLQKQ